MWPFKRKKSARTEAYSLPTPASTTPLEERVPGFFYDEESMVEYLTTVLVPRYFDYYVQEVASVYGTQLETDEPSKALMEEYIANLHGLGKAVLEHVVFPRLGDPYWLSLPRTRDELALLVNNNRQTRYGDTANIYQSDILFQLSERRKALASQE